MAEENYPLHEAVFHGDAARLKNLLDTSKLSIDEKDKFGNTAAHLAVMLNHTECLDLLTQFGASVMTKNCSGWSPLAEAVSFGSRSTIKRVLKRLKEQNRKSLEERRPQLVRELEKLEDFQLQLHWEFHSWVPLVSRLLPSDICNISKRGTDIRMDTTLIEFHDMKWQRGDISFIFSGSKPAGDSLIVLDNLAKVYQRLKPQELDAEVEEEVDYLMSSDIVVASMSTKTISFARAQSGWIFRADRVDLVGNTECDVYSVVGMNLISRKRREHLSEEDVKKNKAFVDAFNKGDSSVMECQEEKPPRRDSLPAPPKTACTWQDYISTDIQKPPHLGRKMIAREERKSIKASVWMSETFPLSVDLLLNVLNVIAPSKHFDKMKEFIALKLPPGFPVKFEIPVMPTVVARITFQDFRFASDLSKDMFVVPSSFKEDPSHFPDL